MKHMRRLICMALMIATVLSLSVSAFAAEYTFESTSDSEYYPSTSYEDIYGSYNYGGINVVDYQIPELSYGCFSTTQTGVMENSRNLPRPPAIRSPEEPQRLWRWCRQLRHSCNLQRNHHHSRLSGACLYQR